MLNRMVPTASALLVFGMTLPSVLAAQSTGTTSVKNVVVVYSHESVLPANVIVDRVLRENMKFVGKSRIEIYSEYLDTARFAEQEHFERSRSYLQKKYADRSIDLLVASASGALDFLIANRETLFPDTPLIYTCVDSERVSADQRLENIPGVPIHLDLLSTLDLARVLQPNARQLYVIAGTSQYDQYCKRRAHEVLAPYEDQFQITYNDDLPFEALLQRVQQIPADSIVLFLLYMKDGSNRHLFSPEAAARVAEVSPAPVYGVFNTYLGEGIVGGYFATFEDLGKATADLGMRILNGEEPKADPTASIALSRNHLDWRQLQRWDLDPKRIPTGTVVNFREPSAWERYPGRIVSAITLIAIQAGLIAILLMQIRSRRIAEALRLASQEIARRQSNELARVNRVTTVGELSTSIAHEVNQPLSAIVSNAQAAIRLLRQSPPDTEEVAAALHDIANDGNRAAGILHHVRSLARNERLVLAPLDLNEVVQNVLQLAAPDVKTRGVTINKELDPSLPSIAGDEIGLQQVILNLLLNAVQAMQETAPDARRIIVRTTHDGAMVSLEVVDRGVGLGHDQLRQVFNPFFTMRPGGIGMGLSICQSIIESHQGEIWVTQNADHGVTFHVCLPAIIEVCPSNLLGRPSEAR